MTKHDKIKIQLSHVKLFLLRIVSLDIVLKCCVLCFIISSKINTHVYTMIACQIQFTVKRRPTYLVLSIMLPLMFLSFLNNLVFVIPVETGSKIGYGKSLSFQ